LTIRTELSLSLVSDLQLITDSQIESIAGCKYHNTSELRKSIRSSVASQVKLLQFTEICKSED
jgi:hypothetical protein